MLKSGSLKPLWDHFIELEAQIRSHTALNIYGLEGKVPKTLMTGQTGDISNPCEFERFQWVVFFFSLGLDILMLYRKSTNVEFLIFPN